VAGGEKTKKEIKSKKDPIACFIRTAAQGAGKRREKEKVTT